MNEDLLARLAALEFGPSKFREGYDRSDVEACRSALGELLHHGDDVRAAYDPSTFRRVPRGEGYARWQVELGFTEIVRAAGMHPVARRIAEARFRPTRARGYDMGDVDQFLDEVEVAAGRGEPIAGLVAAKTFRVVGLREGYEPRSVDEFLAALVADLEDRPVQPEG